jgi:hypothetical protein
MCRAQVGSTDMDGTFDEALIAWVRSYEPWARRRPAGVACYAAVWADAE